MKKIITNKLSLLPRCIILISLIVITLRFVRFTLEPDYITPHMAAERRIDDYLRELIHSPTGKANG